MCFQNLLLGGPVIVVLEKHSPWKCRLFSPAEDASCGGKKMYLHEGKQMFKTLSQCLLMNLLNWMTQSICAGEIRQQSSDGAPYRLAPFVSPQWK